MRIVSLLPSATEMVCALGLRDQLVGVSHECDFPAGVAALPAATQTHIDHHASSRQIDLQVREELSSKQALYSLHSELLHQLAPDLIVTQSLCDVCAVAEADVAALATALPSKPVVFNMQPLNLNDVLDTITLLGKAANVPEAAKSLRATLIDRIDTVRARSNLIKANKKPRVVFLEWLDPPFNAGHWNPELIELAGGIPLLGVAGKDSTMISFEAVSDADPDIIVVGCCGFDIARAQVDLQALSENGQWRKIRCVREANVYLVDGNAYFNRPGPRLIDSLALLAHILHPIHHPLPATVTPALRMDALR